MTANTHRPRRTKAVPTAVCTQAIHQIREESKPMKTFVLSAAAMLGFASSLACAAEPSRQFEREKVLMLYVTKSFGGTRHGAQAPLALGLRLQQSSPLDFHRTLDVFDFRFALGGRTTLSSGGALMFDSLGPDYWDSPYPWIFGGLGLALGASCATGNWPCEDSGESSTNTETPGPTPGSPG